MLFGFFVLGLLAYRTYTDQAPIPGKVVRPDGQVLFTRADVIAGREIFLRNGLMEYRLHLRPRRLPRTRFHCGLSAPLGGLCRRDHDRGSGSESAKADTVTTFKTNRYDPATGTLQFTVAQGEAFESLQKHYSDFFGTPNTKYGLGPNQVTDPAQIRQLTAYFCWSAWVASALLPGTRLLLHQQLAA